jgi:hypothetical protein
MPCRERQFGTPVAVGALGSAVAEVGLLDHVARPSRYRAQTQ